VIFLFEKWNEIKTLLIVRFVYASMGDQLITVEAFENAREQSDEIWSDYEVFEEERDSLEFRELIIRIVEGTVIHPQGHNSYEVEEETISLIDDVVHHGEYVPEPLPDTVQDEFRDDLTDEALPYTKELYNTVRDSHEDGFDSFDSVSEVRTVLQNTTEEISVPENF